MPIPYSISDQGVKREHLKYLDTIIFRENTPIEGFPISSNTCTKEANFRAKCIFSAVMSAPSISLRPLPTFFAMKKQQGKNRIPL